MFKEFHALLMGKDEAKLDEYLGKYGASEIESFCNGIKRDITPVKNAISLSRIFRCGEAVCPEKWKPPVRKGGNRFRL